MSKFRVVVVRNQDWEQPVYRFDLRDQKKVAQQIEKMLLKF